MTGAQLLGAGLIALPFLTLFAVAWREMGLSVAIGLYAATAAIIAIIGGGYYLLTGSLT